MGQHRSGLSEYNSHCHNLGAPKSPVYRKQYQPLTSTNLSLVLLPSVRVRTDSQGGRGAWIPILEKLPNFKALYYVSDALRFYYAGVSVLRRA